MPDNAESLRRHTNPVVFEEGQLIEWHWTLPAKLLIRGARINGYCDLSRREIVKRLAVVLRAWWGWTMALPGERFWDVQRDLIVEVAHGPASRRTIKILTAMAVQYPLVQSCGLDAVMAITHPEPSPYSWADLYRWKDPRNG